MVVQGTSPPLAQVWNGETDLDLYEAAPQPRFRPHSVVEPQSRLEELRHEQFLWQQRFEQTKVRGLSTSKKAKMIREEIEEFDRELERQQARIDGASYLTADKADELERLKEGYDLMRSERAIGRRRLATTT